MFLYLAQVKVVLFTVISANSYYWFLGSTPFEIACGNNGQQLIYSTHENTGGKYRRMRNWSGMSGNVFIIKRHAG